MSDDQVTKRMGKLLRQGAALLNTACPQCNTPLLRLKDGSMYCTKCDREIVEQKTPQTTADARMVSGDILTQLASKALASLEILTQSLPEKPHKEEIRAFASTAKELIEILRGIQELQSR